VPEFHNIKGKISRKGVRSSNKGGRGESANDDWRISLELRDWLGKLDVGLHGEKLNFLTLATVCFQTAVPGRDSESGRPLLVSASLLQAKARS